MNYLLSWRLAGIQRPQPQLQPITFWGGGGGMVTVFDEKLLSVNDYKSLVNIRFENGIPRTREGLYKLTSTGLSGDKYFRTLALIPISGTSTLLGVSDDYKFYKITGSEGSMNVNASIATLSNFTQIFPFAGYAVLCPQSYLLYYNGTAVNICYDDGTGTNGYMFNHITDDNDGGLPLYTGSTTAVGNEESTIAFGSGLTVPFTTLRAWLSRTGTAATGDIVARIWDSSGATLATSTNSIDITTLSTNAALYDFTFSSGTMSPSTAYRYGLYYTNIAGSDASNHPNIHYDTVASGGKGYTKDGAAAWAAATTTNFLLALKPGLPPKANFACVANNRLHVVSSAIPGRLAISAPGDMFDWSTPTLAGYVNSIDDDANSFPIGAVIAKWGRVWIIGRAAQPYLAALSGSSPSDWVIELTGQEVYTSPITVQDTIDDLFFASGINCHSMRGIQEYGDISVQGPGNPIKNLFETYWTTSAFSGYWGVTGQYFIRLPSYGTMVCHTKEQTKRWSQYTFKGLTESAFLGANDLFYVACTDGHIYRLKTGQLTDAGTAYDITAHSGKLRLPFGDCELIILATNMPTTGTTTAKLSLYANDSGTATHEITLSSATFPPEWPCGMNAHSLQIKLDTVAFTAKTFFEPITISARKLYGLGQR